MTLTFLHIAGIQGCINNLFIIFEKNKNSIKKQCNTIVDSVYNPKLDEKQELKILPEHTNADSRREEIYLNYKKALKEKGYKLKFSSDVTELKTGCDLCFI